jgi:two-component system phosphate regulon sensor histidine kinase PhoR
LSPCQISSVIDTVFKTLQMVAGKNGMSLGMEGLEALPPIQADERRLFKAFYNLVNNAIPEVASGGSITVKGEAVPHENAVRISVNDTGRGMSPQVLQGLFTKHVVSGKVGGTGLGIKIAKDAVDAHKGEITVESEVGVGTTFHIRLPIELPEMSEN